jgi:hypothetical protein
MMLAYFPTPLPNVDLSVDRLLGQETGDLPRLV